MVHQKLFVKLILYVRNGTVSKYKILLSKYDLLQ